MLETGEVLRLIMGALALGLAIPVLVQVFLTLRKIQHTIGQIDPTLRLLNQIAQRQSESAGYQPAVPQLPAIIAALVPALVAGYQAFSHQSAPEPAETSGRDSSFTTKNSERGSA
jgi:hypothetical protein